MSDWMEFSAKTVEEATEKALIHFNVNKEAIDIEIVERESKGLLSLFSKSAVIKARLKEEMSGDTTKEINEEIVEENISNDDNIENEDKNLETENAKEDIDPVKIAKDFLMKVFSSMEIETQIEANYLCEDKIVEINLKGDDMGILIGKRGQTLDSLQYLTSLVVNKESKSYIKIKIDTENYRERRKETLENLANNIAHKVKRTRKPVSLEPMNPYDRRIIHSALQNDKYVETHSEGEEPNRKVVITLKKGVRDYSDNKRGGYYRNNKYSNRYDGAKDYKKKFNENYKKSYQSITFDDIKEENQD